MSVTFWVDESRDVHHPVNGGGQLRQVLLDDTPDRFQVDLQVVVSEHVAETGYRPPRHLGLRCS